MIIWERSRERKDCSSLAAVGGGMFGGGLESVWLGARYWVEWKGRAKALRQGKQALQVL